MWLVVFCLFVCVWFGVALICWLCVCDCLLCCVGLACSRGCLVVCVCVFLLVWCGVAWCGLRGRSLV